MLLTQYYSCLIKHLHKASSTTIMWLTQIANLHLSNITILSTASTNLTYSVLVAAFHFTGNTEGTQNDTFTSTKVFLMWLDDMKCF